LWALHGILIGCLVKRNDVLHLAIGKYLLCGLFSVTAEIVFKTETLSDFPGAWWAIIYTSFISVGIGYTLQASSQRVAPPADAAIILSNEQFSPHFLAGFYSEKRLPHSNCWGM